MPDAETPQVTMHELAVVMRVVATLQAAQPDDETINTLNIVAQTDERDLPELTRWHKRSGRAKKKLIDAAFVVLSDAGLFEVSGDQLYITLTQRGQETVQVAQERPDLLPDEIEAAIDGSQFYMVNASSETLAEDAPAPEAAAEQIDESGSEAPAEPDTADPLGGLEGLALDSDVSAAPPPTRRRRNLAPRPETAPEPQAPPTVPEAPRAQATEPDAPDSDDHDPLSGLEGLALNHDEHNVTPPARRRRRGLASRQRAQKAEQAPSEPPASTGADYEADVSPSKQPPARRRRLGHRPTGADTSTPLQDTPFSNQASPPNSRRRSVTRGDDALEDGAGRRQLPSRADAELPPARRLRRSRLDQRTVGPRAQGQAPAPVPAEPLETLPLRDGRTLKISRHSLDLLIAEKGSITKVIEWYEQNADLLNDEG